MNKYGKADAYRRSVIEGMAAMKAEIAKPKPAGPTCFCGAPGIVAVTLKGKPPIHFCREHEAEADAVFAGSAGQR